MMRLFTTGFAIAIAFFGCGDSGKTATKNNNSLAQIDSLETTYFGNGDTKGNPKTAMALIRGYAHFYQTNKGDSLATDMLFKAAEVSMGIGQGNLAVKYFRLIYEDHAQFDKAPEALFLCGFVSENLNADTSDARFYYEKFVKQYPTHHLAADAQFSVLNLGKSDEDLIEMFEKKLKSEN
ncbi:MAG: hypothetical protein JKX84_01030 [Flavobacteriales bacterium]|nr:hypothetical protein [Flavobacteriales bacterium]